MNHHKIRNVIQVLLNDGEYCNLAIPRNKKSSVGDYIHFQKEGKDYYGKIIQFIVKIDDETYNYRCNNKVVIPKSIDEFTFDDKMGEIVMFYFKKDDHEQKEIIGMNYFDTRHDLNKYVQKMSIENYNAYTKEIWYDRISPQPSFIYN